MLKKVEYPVKSLGEVKHLIKNKNLVFPIELTCFDQIVTVKIKSEKKLNSQGILLFVLDNSSILPDDVVARQGN